VAECAALGATGLYAGELVSPVLVFPEDACQEAALDADAAAADWENLPTFKTCLRATIPRQA